MFSFTQSFSVERRRLLVAGDPKTHRIFVSHSHQVDGDNLQALLGMLRSRENINLLDNSEQSQRLKQKASRSEVRKRILESNVVVVFCRPKINSSEMIDFEMETARKAGRPIIALRPPGKRSLSSPAQNYARRVIDWNEDQILSAIRDPFAISRIKPTVSSRLGPASGNPPGGSVAPAAPKPREVIRVAGTIADLPPAVSAPWWKRAFGIGKSR
jgi:hypothetical protein